MNDSPFSIDPRRIPVVGHDIYQVGQIYQILSQPCDIDPIIAVQGFFTYLPTLIWQLVEPDPVDFYLERGGRRHKRKRYKKGKLSPADWYQVPEKGGLSWAVFRAGQVAQRAGWYFLVADATTDFVLNWVSLTYSFSGCSNPFATYAIAYDGYPLPIEPVNPVNWVIPFGKTHSQGSAAATQTAVEVTGAGPISVTCAVQLGVVEYQGKTGHVTAVTLVEQSTVYGYNRYPLKTGSPGEEEGEWTTVLQRFNPTLHNGRYWVEVSWTQGALVVQGGSLKATVAPPTEGLNPTEF